MLGLDPVPDPLSHYAYRRQITVHQSTAATLADFPLSLVVPADPDLVDHAAPDGSDLVVTDARLHPLDREIVSFRNGSPELWVRVPSLPPGDTTLYLYYGGPAWTADARAVWSPAFLGVWHLSETAAIEHDSSGHGHDVTPVLGGMPGTIAGVIGSGQHLDGSPQALCEGDLDGSLELGTSSFAYGAWVQVAAVQSPGPGEPLHKGGSSSSEPGFDLELGTYWVASLATTSDQLGLATNPKLGAWTQMVAVVDRQAGELRTYLDGSLAGTMSLGTLGSLSDPSQQMCIGGDQNGLNAFVGDVDEARVYTQAISPEWIRTEFANVVDRDTFVTVAAEQSLR